MRWSFVLSLWQVSFTLATRYADNRRPPLKDGPEVSANFPDLENIELLSPAFLDPGSIPSEFTENGATPTSQKTLESFLRKLSQTNRWFHYRKPDFASEEGRSIPYVYLTTDNPRNSDGFNRKNRQKLRIWLQGGVHGDEPGGDQGLLALLGKLSANETWAASVLEKADIVVLPRYNPDGAAYFQRQFVTEYDPNRDHAVLQRQQTRDLDHLINRFDPHILVDAHEFTANIPFGADNQWVKAQDIQVSHVKNPNIHHNIRELGEGLFLNSIFSTLQSYGLRTGPYFTGSSGTDDLLLSEPSSISSAGHNSAGLGQRIAFLTESRGIRLGDQHFQRRVAADLIAAEAVIQTAIDNSDEVYRIIEDAREEFVNSTDDVIVVDKARVVETTEEFIDVRNGSVVEIPVRYNNNTPSEIILTRPRPNFYIFSRAYADVAQRLRVFGVEVQELKRDFVGEVQALVAKTVELDSSRFEGIAGVTITTTQTTREVRIPAGGFRVSTRQKNAAWAFALLEPENQVSFAHYNIVPLDEGDEYPIFTVPYE